MLRATQYKEPQTWLYGSVSILDREWDNPRLERAAVKEAVRKQGRCGHLTLGQLWDCHPASDSWPTSRAGVSCPPMRDRQPRTAKQIELARVAYEERQIAADRHVARLKQEAEWRAIERERALAEGNERARQAADQAMRDQWRQQEEQQAQPTTQELVDRAQEAIKRAERIQANVVPANRVDPRLAWQIANHQRKNGGR